MKSLKGPETLNPKAVVLGEGLGHILFLRNSPESAQNLVGP